jgi:hypothetical protein
MANDLTEKALIGGMMAIVMVLVMVQFVGAATPQPQYTCPICGAKFMTYDELYSHFTTEHPSEPIEIIWE